MVVEEAAPNMPWSIIGSVANGLVAQVVAN
jgi:hypothetical protein